MSDQTTLQSILKDFKDDFISSHPLSSHLLKVLGDLSICKTKDCGLHTDVCDSCGDMKTHYNSCRNRNCPLCQMVEKEQWVHKQSFTTLNGVKYFHVVFTIPDTLHSLFLNNQERCYKLLFKASADTLHACAANEDYLGAKIGFTSVLHTWGQNLSYHPHIHIIVAGGGINKFDKWRKSKDKFFLPVKALSKVFRGKLLSLIKNDASLKLPASSTLSLNDVIDACYLKDWVVYSKKPFDNATHVIRYLGRYTHRVAISNSRIVSCVNGMVTFKYKDYKDNNKIKEMQLDANEFIRRFLMHILPCGFMKIRHYGFMSNGNKKTKLKLCKELTNTPILPYSKISIETIFLLNFNIDITVCPCCHKLRHYKLE